MPRGNPRKLIALRIEPELLAALRERTDNMTAAIEAGIRLWLAREKRRPGVAERERQQDRLEAARRPKPDRLAKHLSAPSAREIAARQQAAAQPANVEIGENGFVRWPKTDGE